MASFDSDFTNLGGDKIVVKPDGKGGYIGKRTGNTGSPSEEALNDALRAVGIDPNKVNWKK